MRIRRDWGEGRHEWKGGERGSEKWGRRGECEMKVAEFVMEGRSEELS